MRGLNDHLRRLGKGGNHAAHGNHAERLGLVRRETAHPLMQHGGHFYIVIAVFMQVFIGQLLQRLDGCDILHKVAALAIAYGDVLHALLGGEQRLNHSCGVGDARRHEGAGERTVGLAIDRNAHLLIQAGQPVHVLPVADGARHGNVLAIGQVVGDAAALIAGEAAGIGDLGKQPSIRRAMTHLYGHMHALDHLTAFLHAMVDSRETVEHGAVKAQRFVDAVFGFLVAVLAGIAVNGRRQQIRLALILQMPEQLDMAIHNRNACTGLHKGLLVLFGIEQLLGKDALFIHGLMIGDSLVKIDVLAGRPLEKNLCPQGMKLRIRNPFVLNVHRIQAPFSSIEAPFADNIHSAVPWLPECTFGPRGYRLSMA